MNQKRTITVSDVCQKWLEEVRGSVRSSSILQYDLVVQKYILPGIGNIPAAKLNSDVLRAFLDHLLRDPSYHGKPLSVSTVSQIRTILKMILTFGEEQNVMPQIRLRYRIPSGSGRMGRCLPPDDARQIERALSGCQEPRLYGILLCLDMGLRLGELCALRWEDFDFDNHLLNVRHTVKREEVRTPDGAIRSRWIIGLPKSSSSNRQIPIPAHMENDLLAMHRLAADSSCYFLNGRSDRFVQPRSYQRTFREFLDREEISPINIHSLRHSFATRCIHATDARTVSELLGHSDPTVTMRLYVHTTMETKRKAMDEMERKRIHDA